MSEYTRRQILDMIEGNGGPEGLDLSDTDLSGIDLSRETIERELKRVHDEDPELAPSWHCLLRGYQLPAANLERVNLRKANLEGANLDGINLRKANLMDANLQGADLFCADLQRAFARDANLEEANLAEAKLKGAHLEGTNLKGAGLQEANLKGTRLWRADLEGSYAAEADLREAVLTDAKLDGACLAGADLSRVYLMDVRSMKGIYLYRALLDHTQLTKNQLGIGVHSELRQSWFQAREAYLGLKNNFEQIGRYNDASWAYRKERRMGKRQAWQNAKVALQEHRWGTAICNSLKVASDQLVELVCDYGEGIWRVIGSLLFLWLVFAVSYGIIAGVWGPWQKTATGEIRYVTRNPTDLLLFSIGVTSRMPAGLEARPILGMRILMATEAIVSTVLAGLLGFVVGNRVRRS